MFYRPPPSTANGLTTSAFITEWTEFISQQALLSCELLIVGDVNIHLDRLTNLYTRDFIHSLESNGLQQR